MKAWWFVKVVVGESTNICPKTSRFGFTAVVETNPVIDTEPPAIVVENELGKFVTNVEMVLGIFTTNDGFVTYVEIVLGIFTTNDGFVTKVERVLGTSTLKFNVLTLNELNVKKEFVEIPAPHKVTQFVVEMLV